MIFYVAGALLLASVGLPNALRAQTADTSMSPIGKVTSVTGAATIEHSTAVVLQAAVPGNAQAKVDDFVYQGDVVQTGRDGKLGMAFADGTTFNISSNARMVLNEFIYDPKGTANSTLFSLSKGTFNFVAGKVAKTGNMRFDTAVATMGIRGTTPRVEVAEDGTVTFDTLIEDKSKLEAAMGAPPSGGPSPPRQRQTNNTAAPPDDPALNKAYGKLMKFDYKICSNC
jgi:hypothetical protein